MSGIGDRPRTGQGRGSSSPCTQGEGKGEDSSKARHPWRKTIKNNLLICLEKPGQTFTPDQAAALAGVSRKALLQSVTPSMISKGYKTGGLSFRRAGDARPALSKVEGPPPDHEARPRHSNGLSTARNPYMVGAAARVPQAAEYPTEAAP
ncbi:MAG: hypothetical protein IT447_15510 [Phycisphaerales bacterium]|nr:hypothetical protein [Phycisphaerales bacterium]